MELREKTLLAGHLLGTFLGIIKSYGGLQWSCKGLFGCSPGYRAESDEVMEVKLAFRHELKNFRTGMFFAREDMRLILSELTWCDKTRLRTIHVCSF